MKQNYKIKQHAQEETVKLFKDFYYDNGSYTQAPFEDITEEKFLEMESHLNGIDLTKVTETSDETNLQDQAACAGGACEVV